MSSQASAEAAAPDVTTYPFKLTDEQEQMRREIRDFAQREIAPNVMKWDEASEFPADVVKQLGQMGLMGMIFPVEYGGAGLGYVDYMTAIEELSAVDGSVGIIVAAHNSLCTNHIFLAGNEEQRRKYIPKLASGEWLGAWGLTEPNSGSDAAGAKTKWAQPITEQSFAVHLLGTCRMGNDPKKSVINADHRTHDVKNLFLCDGSSLVTSGRGQPTMTIQALSYRAADRITDLAKRGEIAS